MVYIVRETWDTERKILRVFEDWRKAEDWMIDNQYQYTFPLCYEKREVEI